MKLEDLESRYRCPKCGASDDAQNIEYRSSIPHERLELFCRRCHYRRSVDPVDASGSAGHAWHSDDGTMVCTRCGVMQDQAVRACPGPTDVAPSPELPTGQEGSLASDDAAAEPDPNAICAVCSKPYSRCKFQSSHRFEARSDVAAAKDHGTPGTDYHYGHSVGYEKGWNDHKRLSAASAPAATLLNQLRSEHHYRLYFTYDTKLSQVEAVARHRHEYPDCPICTMLLSAGSQTEDGT